MTRSLIAFSLFAMICSGCGNSSFLNDRVKEGTIEYSLSFPDYDPNGIMGGMLPEKTTLSFTGEKQVAELTAGMGIFRTSMITDNGVHSMDYHMSMMSKKIVAHIMPNDLQLFNSDRKNPTIIYTDDTDTIAGYPCRKAIAIYDELDQPEMEIWYTDRIEMKDPNWFSPFADVPGVLLRYELIQHGIRMQLNAISIVPGPVDPKKFEVKKEYQTVAPNVLHQELAEVLGTFSM